MIHFFYELPDLSFAVVGLIVEVGAPVAEIAGDNKNCVLIIEIGCEVSSQFLEGGFLHLANDDRNYFFVTNGLADERHVHFKAMLLLLILFGKRNCLDV